MHFIQMLSNQSSLFLIKRRKQIMPVGPANSQNALDRTVIEYAGLFKHDGPYLDAAHIQIQQLLLSQIGYVFSTPDAEGSDLTGRNVEESVSTDKVSSYFTFS